MTNAFILSSLREVVNVWARGYGQATFNLSIVDGFADLQHGFQLGHPNDPHLLPQHIHTFKSARKVQQDVKRIEKELPDIRLGFSLKLQLCPVFLTSSQTLMSFFPKLESSCY